MKCSVLLFYIESTEMFYVHTSSFSNIAGFDENGEGSDLGHEIVSSSESNCDPGLAFKSLSSSSNTDRVEIGLLHITILG